MKNIFIDGSAGTTAIQIQKRLADTPLPAHIITLDEHERKQPDKRKQALNDCDIALLCLPDEASRDAVSMITNDNVKILDASSAHRTTQGWIYGLEEHNPLQASLIAKHRFVTNPGCYPVGSILLLAPLMRHKVISEDYPFWIHGVSGYSGGGKNLIERYEHPHHPDAISSGYRAYGLTLNHKHVQEIYYYALLKQHPMFTPVVAPFYSGMMITIALQLPNHNMLQQIYDIYHKTYESYPKVIIDDKKNYSNQSKLYAEDYCNTDTIVLTVIEGERSNQLLLVARYDNLGKGASGNAMQNLRLML